MRNSMKRQVLEFITNIRNAHVEVKNAIEKKETILVQNMLGELQELSISLGEIIEQSEGKNFVTVTYLEEYCELLYQVYNMLHNDKTNPYKVYKLLEKQISKVEKSVENDIPGKKEAVFFPYKAAMWDSLESIYFELKKDPEYDVYCVPIPYYEVNPDRSLGKMHYEGDAYPKDVKVYDWKNYNFEERNPDEIYIHNAYDDWNLVTSIHPRFYSKNLKQHTDKLVYVPYFVMGEFDINNEIATASRKHFCFAPGIILADKVILESESVKEFYVREYIKASKENGLSGKHIDKEFLEKHKFFNEGSPKYKKVFNTKIDEINIPEEWLKVITKSDGTYKKIILYNTSITALLNYNEEWLKKIESVLKIFEENRDNVALLWRPHPLIKNTLRSMRYDYLAEFERIEEKYIQSGWGIYDKSPDLDRAIVLSDAYYGDMSSVVQLFQITGKPIMIQNVKMIK